MSDSSAKKPFGDAGGKLVAKAGEFASAPFSKTAEVFGVKNNDLLNIADMATVFYGNPMPALKQGSKLLNFKEGMKLSDEATGDAGRAEEKKQKLKREATQNAQADADAIQQFSLLGDTTASGNSLLAPTAKTAQGQGELARLVQLFEGRTQQNKARLARPGVAQTRLV